MQDQKNIIMRVSDFVEKLSIWFSVAIVSVLAINLIAAVIFRYFFNHPIYWADELSLVLFGWITFLGASIGVKRSEMASVTLLVGRLKGRALFIAHFFIQSSIALFALILGVYGFKWITSESIISQMATTIPIPIWVTFAILPISMVLIIIFCVDNINRLIRFGSLPLNQEEMI